MENIRLEKEPPKIVEDKSKIVNNSELVEHILKQSLLPNEKSNRLTEHFKNVDLTDNKAIGDNLFPYAMIKEEFLEVFIGKIYLTRSYTQIWENVLRLFHKGRQEYGTLMEMFHVGESTKVGFDEHFPTSSGSVGTEESDLFGKTVPKVLTSYIARTYKDKYKVTISDLQLRTAFTTPNGLQTLLNDLMSANIRAAYEDEYQYTVDAFKMWVKGFTNKDGGLTATATITQYLQKSQIIELGQPSSKELMKQINIMSEELKLNYDGYNVSGVKQFSKPNQMVLVTNSENKVSMDFDVLAETWHMEKREIPNRIVTMRKTDMPTDILFGTVGQTSGGTVLANQKVEAMLVDERLVNIVDFIFQEEKLRNPNKLYTNYWLHKQGMVGLVPFVNGVIFTSTIPTPPSINQIDNDIEFEQMKESEILKIIEDATSQLNLRKVIEGVE